MASDSSQAVEVIDRLDDDERSRVHQLLAAAEAADRVAALNEQAWLALTAGDESDVRHVLATAMVDGTRPLVGYAQLDLSAGASGAAAEAVVHPQWRRRGWGGQLIRRAIQEAAPYSVLLWSHGDHPDAAGLAARHGFERVRELWRMRRDLVTPLPGVELPAGVRLRTFVGGADEPAWLEVNARAFADHPEQGNLDAADLTRRMDEDWFDADGFLLAERDGRLVGFHWTKVYPGDGHHPSTGEVYVVGVDPDAQGSGLGRALTLAGLHHLRDHGLSEVLLYVEADNLAARKVYERLDFQHVATETRYRHRGIPS